MMAQAEENFNNIFGDIDLELLDLILKGYFKTHQKILDVGCGEGRNLIYFLQHDYDVYAIDTDRSSVDLVRYMAKNFGKNPNNIVHQSIMDDNPDLNTMDAIICTRVLHFIESESSFLQVWDRLTQILKRKGTLYLSMDSMIGFENHVRRVDDNKWQFSDGSIRYLLTNELVDKMNISTKYQYLSPIKTIHYEDKHAQTVMCLSKK